MTACAQLAPTPSGLAIVELLDEGGEPVTVCSCDEALALRRELARMQARLEARDQRVAETAAKLVDGRAFCPLCGVGVGFDEEGCCTACGATVCSMHHLAAHLAVVGLRLEG